MKKLLSSINILFCILLLSSSCNNNVGGGVTKSTGSTTGGKNTGNSKDGSSVKPEDSMNPPNDTSIRISPNTGIKHGSKDQELLDSLKRNNMKKKRGG
ncbi:MAG: hypothetical protein IPM92_04280 [Saprospiraceae bacterium]|nr:hypothetical protein [Saprospiraceae bacterium]